MIDSEKLMAEVNAELAAAVPVELCRGIAVATAPCGCCPQLRIAGSKTLILADLNKASATALAKTLLAFSGRTLPQPSVN